MLSRRTWRLLFSSGTKLEDSLHGMAGGGHEYLMHALESVSRFCDMMSLFICIELVVLLSSVGSSALITLAACYSCMPGVRSL